MLAPFTLAIAIAMTPARTPGLSIPDAPDRPIARHVERAVFEPAPAPLPSRQAQPPGGDSLRNGATIGAITAGAIMLVSTAWLCYATREEGDPQCFGAIFFWTAAGAGAGALIGAGVDALVQRRVGVRWTVRF